MAGSFCHGFGGAKLVWIERIVGSEITMLASIFLATRLYKCHPVAKRIAYQPRTCHQGKELTWNRQHIDHSALT